MNKLTLILMGYLLTISNVNADNATIISANNQAFINTQLGYGKLSYNNNRPADAGAPLFNSSTKSQGGELGITKTFRHLYSQIILGSNNTTSNYSDSALNLSSLSNGTAVTLSLQARAGYSFYPQQNLAITPYLLGGYTNNQLNTGGYSASFIPAYYNGTTIITQSFNYGLGVLSQWVVTSNWVLNADLQIGSNTQSSASGNVSNFNNQPIAITTYQHWNLSNAVFWQINLGSDYLVSNNVHLRANAAYGQNNLGSMNSNFRGNYPSQHQQSWLWILGLGYSLADINGVDSDSTGGVQGAIHATNNLAGLELGYQIQQFHGGTTLNTYNQTTNVPTVGLVFSKTWKAVYTQITLNEGMSVTSNQTQNTFLNTAGKLGYQFASSHNTAVTPYVTAGYHRWLQNIQGTASNQGNKNNIATTYYINGTTATYQHDWYGVGALGQWAVSPKLVLSADGNVGRTFNASMHAWAPVFLPLDTSYSISDAWYQMITLGADYSLGKNWHAQGNVSYWHYNYNASGTNAIAASTLNDSVRQMNATIGLAYSFG